MCLCEQPDSSVQAQVPLPSDRHDTCASGYVMEEFTVNLACGMLLWTGCRVSEAYPVLAGQIACKDEPSAAVGMSGTMDPADTALQHMTQQDGLRYALVLVALLLHN